MKATKKGQTAPNTRLRTTLAYPLNQRARGLLAVNLIDAVLMTATNRAKALVSLAFSAAA